MKPTDQGPQQNHLYSGRLCKKYLDRAVQVMQEFYIRYMLSRWEVVNRTKGEALSSAYGHPIHGSVNRSGGNMQVVSCH